MQQVFATPIATVLAVAVAVAGVVAVATGHLTYKEFFESVSVLLGGLAVGRGLAANSVD